MEIIAGLIIGLLIGLTGIGAGTITAPLLIMVWNIDPPIAVGTALFFSTVVKAVSSLTYLKAGNIDKKYITIMAGGGIPGVIGGSWLINVMDKDFRSLVLLIVGLIVLISSLINIFTCLFPYKEYLSKFGDKPPLFLLPLSALIGLEVGFTSAGAGALGTAFLLLFTKMNISKIIGTDLSFGLIISFVGALLHSGYGNIEWGILKLMLIGGVVGALVGSFVGNRYPRNKLKLVVSLMLLIIASNLIYKSIEGGMI